MRPATLFHRSCSFRSSAFTSEDLRLPKSMCSSKVGESLPPSLPLLLGLDGTDDDCHCVVSSAITQVLKRVVCYGMLQVVVCAAGHVKSENVFVIAIAACFGCLCWELSAFALGRDVFGASNSCHFLSSQRSRSQSNSRINDNLFLLTPGLPTPCFHSVQDVQSRENMQVWICFGAPGRHSNLLHHPSPQSMHLSWKSHGALRKEEAISQ